MFDERGRCEDSQDVSSNVSALDSSLDIIFVAKMLAVGSEGTDALRGHLDSPLEGRP